MSGGGVSRTSETYKKVGESRQKEWKSEVSSLRGGYSGRTLSTRYNQILTSGFRNPQKMGEDVFRTGLSFGSSGRKIPSNVFRLNPQTGQYERMIKTVVGESDGGARDYKISYKQVSAWRAFGYKSEQAYQDAQAKFKEQTGKTPEPWEFYLYSAVGLTEKKMSAKEKAEQRAKEAAGEKEMAPGTSDAQLAAFGAKKSEDVEASPWV